MRAILSENLIEAAMALVTILLGLAAIWYGWNYLAAAYISLENVPMRAIACIIGLSLWVMLYHMVNATLGNAAFLMVYWIQRTEQHFTDCERS